MANKIKISELIPKDAPLSTTDLFMIAEVTPDGYDSKSITGAEIITTAQEGLQPTLVSGTNIKTVNSTSLLGSGDVAVQPTLVSGTNIKTVNGNSLLGSGDLVISTGLTIGTTAIASGTVGRLLFEGTGNVVQESSQLSWNNTTNALTITTGKTFSAYQSSQPNDALKLEVNNLGAVFAVQNSNSSGFSGIEYLSNTGVARVFTGFNNGNGQEFRFNNFATGGYIDFLISTSALRIANTRNILIGTTTDAGYKLDVNGTARVTGNISINQDSSIGISGGPSTRPSIQFGTTGILNNNWSFVPNANGGITIASSYQTISSNSAIFEIASTTRGFLPPRMTTTQRNAIASPASGLIVYDTTDNKHYGYNGTAWTAFY